MTAQYRKEGEIGMVGEREREREREHGTQVMIRTCIPVCAPTAVSYCFAEPAGLPREVQTSPLLCRGT